MQGRVNILDLSRSALDENADLISLIGQRKMPQASTARDENLSRRLPASQVVFKAVRGTTEHIALQRRVGECRAHVRTAIFNQVQHTFTLHQQELMTCNIEGTNVAIKKPVHFFQREERHRLYRSTFSIDLSTALHDRIL